MEIPLCAAVTNPVQVGVAQVESGSVLVFCYDAKKVFFFSILVPSRTTCETRPLRGLIVEVLFLRIWFGVG